MTWWALISAIVAAGVIGYICGAWGATDKLLDALLREAGERARADKLQAELERLRR